MASKVFSKLEEEKLVLTITGQPETAILNTFSENSKLVYSSKIYCSNYS